ncbi:MAG: hypothetical protein AMJ70_05350 [Dehalococcoidia bacterium SG8_51_3]|nr:MAG: hypothetical protein AMJ70_05350 [Dehalococcoidia bacterium SG8_51_3]
MNVALKYCGSCNPQIELSDIGHKIEEALQEAPDIEVVPRSSKAIDVMVILCGCPRACGDKKRIRKRASHCIVVAGESVDLVPVAEKDLLSQVIQKVKSLSTAKS